MVPGDARGKESRARGGWLGLVGIGIAIVSLFMPSRRITPAEAKIDEDRKFRRMVFHGWLVVCGIAVAFVLYGFLAFFVVGDKGPPDWDYGSIEDVPGQSVHSTYPYRGRVPKPEPQHVDQRPSAAKTAISERQGSALPE
jgi:hypothetical protein